VFLLVPSVLLKVINTELQFVFFDSVWATEARPTCRVNEIKHLRDNYMKYIFALILYLAKPSIYKNRSAGINS
jgi:hypothetical protein